MNTATIDELQRILALLTEPDLAAVRAFAQFLQYRRRQAAGEADYLPDSLLAFLAAAPIDDEPTTAEESASADEALREFKRGEYCPPDVAAELLSGRALE